MITSVKVPCLDGTVIQDQGVKSTDLEVEAKVTDEENGEILKHLYPLLQKSAEKLIVIVRDLAEGNKEKVIKFNAQKIKVLFEQAFDELEKEVKQSSNERIRSLVQKNVKHILLKFIDQGTLTEGAGEDAVLTIKAVPTDRKVYPYWFAEIFYNHVLYFFFQEYGFSVCKLQYSNEELVFFDAKQLAEQAPAKRLSCFNFTLLKAKELKAKDYIFSSKFGFWGSMLEGNPNFARFLLNSGHTLVTSPIKNDIVVFRDKKGEPSHASFCLSENLRLSKLSLYTDYIIIHPKELLESIHGTNFAYYRKQTEATDQPLLSKKRKASTTKND